MRREIVSLSVLACTALWGCGGGGGSSSVNPLTQGRSAINSIASGQQSASATNLLSALSLFQQALQQNPGSVEASFFQGICLGGIAGQELGGGSRKRRGRR